MGGHPPPLQNEPGSPESETLRPEAGPGQIYSRGGVRPAPGSGAGAGTSVGQPDATGCAFVQDPLPECPGAWGWSLVLKGLSVKDLHLLRAPHAQMCFHKFARTGHIQRN